ncbi:alpha/beta fold hydrolase [Thermocoleostomius sinensis]|jgi:pimeloyl-ACP methyl ester carboxylesterase|uniref:Alpha/beta hydrolase n=1 Tax=Thermocoleostomius sinensis A174 TaxID=2016057 RepID=A0A9E8Z972_9CYAN|nr:alpha/beta hydrolase [Thermocoleostomius sinensis]WAL58626.1 alpha/beta hydrolase [Thermocoleostomius sinensis A174]
MTSISGTIHEFHWSWQKKPITAIYEVLGEGPPILLLPAFSSVSTREEMRGLAEHLCSHYQAILVDWPGFGQSSRPALNYQPAVYRSFLKDFVRSVFAEPVVVIAAGHAAGYVMELAQRSTAPWSWVVLVAPTWRGPLPTAMGENRWFYTLLRWLIKLPLLGQFLYLLNTLPPFLRFMMRRHVFAEPKHVTRSLIAQKWRTTQKWGARHASAAFVTGALDPVRQRREFVEQFQPLPPLPVMLVIGEQTPPKSLAEMEFLAHFTGVQVYRMPGSLGLHEEYPDRLADGILPFLRKYLS